MTTESRLSTGIEGLDRILGGGLLDLQNVLIRGPPGAGKTIFGLHFLAAKPDGEASLYINLGEPADYVKETARAFDLDSEELHFLELVATEERFSDEGSYTLFNSGEVEQPSLVNEVRETIEERQPKRVLIDPITEFRYLTTDDHQFRAQIMGLLDFLRSQDATVMMTSQAATDLSDTDLQFLTDVVINLDNLADGKSIDVTKFRGPSVLRGPHSFDISAEGITVWPRLYPSSDMEEYPEEKLSSGVPELDQLLKGGLSRGTVTFFSGPTGAGKTTTGMQFVKEAASRGDKSLILSFEESKRTLLQRSKALNIALGPMVEQGKVEILEVLPQKFTVNELLERVRLAVEEDDIKLVLLDGLQGYKQNVRGLGEDPTKYLVTLGRYLHNKGVTTLVTNEVHDITGNFRVTEEGLSNLADNIIFIRHVEHHGQIEKVIGVLKMRTSSFEKTLRRIEFTEYGISVGDPLNELQGVLTGTPEWSRKTDQAETDDSA